MLGGEVGLVEEVFVMVFGEVCDMGGFGMVGEGCVEWV